MAQTALQTRKSVTTDVQHNIGFRKIILGVMGKAANSYCTGPTLKSSQFLPAPMAPLRYRLVFTSLPRQPCKWENILCCPTIVALAVKVWRQEDTWGWKSRGATEQQHMPLACIVQAPIKEFQSAAMQPLGPGWSQVGLGDKTLERSKYDQYRGLHTNKNSKKVKKDGKMSCIVKFGCCYSILLLKCSYFYRKVLL